MQQPAAVIIGNHTQGLGILRSAATAGFDVWVVNDKGISLSRFSKHLSGYVQVRRGMLGQLDDTEAAESLLRVLLEVPVEDRSLLFGVNEDIVRFIYRNRTPLAQKYFIPAARLDRVYDKYLFNSLLPESAQIQTFLCSETDIGNVTSPKRFVLKGRQGNAFRRLTGEKAERLDRVTPTYAARLFTSLPPDQVILQEIIDSDRPVTSVCSFSVEGETVAVFAYEKLRQHPNRFGTGTYLKSVGADALAPLAARVVRAVQFTGVSEIEFIHDPRTGVFKVIEMNPRTWKSVHFATQCGQNLVARYLTYVATGRVERDGQRYACDRYWADLATDIPQLIRDLSLPRYHRAFFECTWDRSDPLPALALMTAFPLMALESVIVSMIESRRRKAAVGGRATH